MNEEVMDLLRSYIFQDDLSRERKVIFWYDEKEAYKDEIDNKIILMGEEKINDFNENNHNTKRPTK